MKASNHAAGGTDAVSTYSQNLWKYSKKVYKMKYNGIIWTFLFMSQESKKCISNFCITLLNSKIFLLGKLSQLTRKKPKVNKQIYFSGWLVSLYAIVCKKKKLSCTQFKENGIFLIEKAAVTILESLLINLKKIEEKKTQRSWNWSLGHTRLSQVGQGC